MARKKKKNRYKTGVYVSSKTHRAMQYRSSYELRLMHCLDKDDHVIDYDYEPFAIYHIQNRVMTDLQVELSEKKKHRSYTPDFVVKYDDSTVLMIEVKSVGTLYASPTIRKKVLGEQYCSMHKMKYVIWTLDEIIPYEIKMGIVKPDHEAWQNAEDF